MLETLLNNDLCVDRVGQDFDVFLVQTPYGVRVLSNQDAVWGAKWGEGHYDQLLQVLGEAGVSSATPVTTASGYVGTVGELIQDSLARFSMSQELEFTTCALARWLPPHNEWTDRFGEPYTFDDVAAALVQKPLGEGTCHGTHLPFALINLLRADECHPLFEEGTRNAAKERLRILSVQLDRSQLPQGGWDRRWSGNYDPRNTVPGLDWTDTFDRIAATGHHLEWIALAPSDLRPSDVTVRHAIRSISRDIAGLPPIEQLEFKAALPLSHAARALALLRNVHPFLFWQDAHSKRKPQTAMP